MKSVQSLMKEPPSEIAHLVPVKLQVFLVDLEVNLIQELIQSQMVMSPFQVEHLVPVKLLQVLVDLDVSVICHLDSGTTVLMTMTGLSA